MRPLAELLDETEKTDGKSGNRGNNEYARALDLQLEKVRDPEATPSARVLREMRERKESFYEFGLRMSAQHAAMFKQKPMDAEKARGAPRRGGTIARRPSGTGSARGSRI